MDGGTDGANRPPGAASTPDVAPPRVRHRAALVSLCLAVAVVGMNTTSIGVTTRGISEELGVSLSTLEWVLGAYLVAGAAFALVGGRLGDVIGRTRTLVIGIVVLAGGSVLAALAPGPGVLIAARAVQGIGAALVLPASIEVAAAHAAATGPQPAFRARGIVYATAFGVGPLVGGVLTDFVSWRAVFWLEAALLGLAVLAAIPIRTAVSRVPRTPTRDVAGAILSSALVLIVITFVSRGRLWGWWSWPSVTLGVLGALVAVALVRVEARTERPLLHRELLRDPAVLGANVAMLGASIGMIGLIYFFALFATSALAFDTPAVRVAVALVPFAASVAGFAVVSSFLGRRYGAEAPVLVGLGLSVVGFALLAQAKVDSTEAELALPLILCGVGAGVANAGLTTPAVMTHRRRIDEAAGLVALTRFLGSALAVAIGTATYLTVAVGPHTAAVAATGADPEATALGGAAYEQAVANLRDDLRRPFEAAAQASTVEAFTSTMRLAAVTVAVLGALATFFFLLATRQERAAPDG